MDAQSKESLRRRIEQEIETLRETIAQLEESSRPVAPDTALGRLTRMEALGSRAVSEAALRSTRDKYTQLTKALARMDHADFGICNLCKEPLDAERLLTLPDVRLCAPCQLKLRNRK
jgi:DnaK suppressor protein